MRIVVGNVVTGEDFFEDRLVLVQRLEERLRISDILVLGPRRTGKTSLIKEYLRQQEERDKNFKYIFLNLEPTQNLYDFYVRIIREVLRSIDKWKLCQHHIHNMVTNASNLFNKIFGNGINLSDIIGLPSEMPITINFPEFEPKNIAELRQQLEEIIKKIDIPIVIVLDEFPELIWKLGADKPKEAQTPIRKQQTSLMLAGLRALRQELDGTKARHKIIIAGSVNLSSTLEHLGLDNLINDIERLTIPNLTPVESTKLFHSLISFAKFQFEQSLNIDQFIEKQFGYTAPFYIQVFASALIQMQLDRGKTVFSEEDFTTCYKILISSPGIRYLKNRIERFYGDKTETVYGIIANIAKKQFTEGLSISEEIALDASKNLTREQQTELLSQMKADDLIQAKGLDYYFESQLLCNFWHYTLVGSQFLTLGR